MKNIKRTIIVILLVLSFECILFASLGNSKEEITFERSSILIKGAKVNHKFNIALALTRVQHSYGLMYREQLGKNEGMLFFYKKETIATMWMLNTFIPLDMIFVDSKGKIIYIFQDTTPFSIDKISANGLVRGVLEVNAGIVEQLGIIVGDRLIHPLFFDGDER